MSNATASFRLASSPDPLAVAIDRWKSACSAWCRTNRAWKDCNVLFTNGASSIPMPNATFQRMSNRARSAASSSLTRSWLCNSSALARMLGGTLTRPLFVVYSGLKSSSRNSAGSCRARKP